MDIQRASTANVVHYALRLLWSEWSRRVNITTQQAIIWRQFFVSHALSLHGNMIAWTIRICSL